MLPGQDGKLGNLHFFQANQRMNQTQMISMTTSNRTIILLRMGALRTLFITMDSVASSFKLVVLGYFIHTHRSLVCVMCRIK